MPDPPRKKITRDAILKTSTARQAHYTARKPTDDAKSHTKPKPKRPHPRDEPVRVPSPQPQYTPSPPPVTFPTKTEIDSDPILSAFAKRAPRLDRMTTDPKHLDYMRQALELSKLSPLKETNFRVGALLVNSDTDEILSTGYTLECRDNMHAEHCAMQNFQKKHNLWDFELRTMLPMSTVLYTTMEPCCKRMSGEKSCVARILELGDVLGGNSIGKIYVGVKEPEKFVGENTGRADLEKGKIKVIHVLGMEEEILKVATEGHVKDERREMLDRFGVRKS